MARQMTVRVNRKAYHGRSGKVGLSSDTNRGAVEPVTAVYADGRVRTVAGDTWKVKRDKSGLADYVVAEPTFRPQDPGGSAVVEGY